MSGQEVAIIAIAEPAPGKADRFKELTVGAIKWMKANEPGTLEWSLFEETGDKGIKFFMYEKYASQEALETHEASENYKQFFQTATEEKLLNGPPTIVKGDFVAALTKQ